MINTKKVSTQYVLKHPEHDLFVLGVTRENKVAHTKWIDAALSRTCTLEYVRGLVTRHYTTLKDYKIVSVTATETVEYEVIS